ncbi:MAG: hypothetical protein JRJ85_15265 [Deltaproteobacteria bacterium]|nr:hypothetical protein [Deltaproteobacteria bacterium]
MKKHQRAIRTGVIILITCIFAFTLSTAAVASGQKGFTPKQGKLFMKEIGDVKFHTYFAKGMVSHIIETKNVLIMQDTVQMAPHNAELKAFIQSLNKPVERIIISHLHDHHWLGLEMFEGSKIYALEDVIKKIREKGQGMLQGAKKRFGEKMIPYNKVVIPSYFVNPGEETIDGLRVRFIQPSEPWLKRQANLLWMEFPDQKVIIIHHLAYVGMHFPPPPIPARIAKLKELKAKGYNYIMPGHGLPLPGAAFADQATAYFETVQKVVKASPDVKTAKEKLMKAYPKYGAPYLLDMMLPFHYKK